MVNPIYSADSHVTEHPETYTRHIDPAYRDRAPHVVHQDGVGDAYVIPGMQNAFLPIGLIAAAGKKPEDIRLGGSFDDWYPGGFDPHAGSPTRTATGSPARSSTRRSAWSSATTPTSTTSAPA